MKFVLFLALLVIATAAVVEKQNLRVKGAQECATDVENAAKDIAAAGAGIALAVKTCADGFTQQCNADISSVLQNLTATSADITAAVYDCSGDVPTACSADINACIANVSGATTAIMDAVLDCQDTNKLDECRADVQKSVEQIAQLGVNIAKAVNDC